MLPSACLRFGLVWFGMVWFGLVWSYGHQLKGRLGSIAIPAAAPTLLPQAPGPELVGRRIEVFWGGDRKWYPGEVTALEGRRVRGVKRWLLARRPLPWRRPGTFLGAPWGPIQ